MADEVKSAVRVLEMLELLAANPAPLPLKNIAQELGYPKSSTLQLLRTLVTRGYVQRDAGDAYGINAACRSGPGWTAGYETHLIAMAQPILLQLRDACGETVMLGTRMRTGRLKTIAKCVGNLPVRYDSELAGGLPSYCSALGRVLLAHWDPASTRRHLDTEHLVKLTRFTITDRAKLQSLIAAVARNGYAMSDQEMDIGACGIAAPVFGADGTVVAALNIAAIAQRFAMAKRVLRDQVILHARLLSERLAAPGNDA